MARPQTSARSRYGAISQDLPTFDDTPTLGTYLYPSSSLLIPLSLLLIIPFGILQPMAPIRETFTYCATKMEGCSNQAEFETLLLSDADVISAFKAAIFLFMLWAGPTAVFTSLNALLPPYQNQREELTLGQKRILRANIAGNLVFAFGGIVITAIAYWFLRQNESLHDAMAINGLDGTTQEDIAQKQLYMDSLRAFSYALAAVQGGIAAQGVGDVIAAGFGATTKILSPVMNGAWSAVCRRHPTDLETDIPIAINGDQAARRTVKKGVGA